jgi:hypothetical protein
MKPFIGVDLDGTLAIHPEWSIPNGPEDIGEPIPEMVNRVKQWIADGKEVKIFTARACKEENILPVKAWCKKYIGVELDVTNVKTPNMMELWDDRAISVIRNTGEVPSVYRPIWDWVD